MTGDRRKFDYHGKNILAPMVRVGTLPTRLLALEFGADLVYSEELIDYRLLKCKRVENTLLGSIDYIDAENQILYRTCAAERGRNIVQIGTCSPERAVRVANMIKADVAGIDVNMGCPKEFSIKGNMGAALLTQPERIEAILTALREALPDHLVTCKIRVFDDVEKTIELCKRMEATGVDAIGVHGRTRDERPQHANRNAAIKAVADALRIPVIANGGSSEIRNHEDIDKFRRNCGAAAVMIARQAEENVSIFRKEGMLSWRELVDRYLSAAIVWDNRFPNTKYCIQRILGSLQDSTDEGRKFLHTRCMEDICDIWGFRELFEEKQAQWETGGSLRDIDDDGTRINRGIKRKMENDPDTFGIEVKFCRNLFGMSDLPKTVLLNKSRAEGLEQPDYEIIPVDKMFRAVVVYGGKKYTSLFREKNKRMAEQGAALVCLFALGVMGDDKIRGESEAKLFAESLRKA
ncbi:tRNA-dihydrouridine(20) synthase [NAD(P)+]-like [Galendromus occidentalis]|uniref:tRNA-dihydrouridine(20) synthase [NAD(P)+]-like n=1 Tax=Galendromus occidentalis TaxID=34638 RepID=A0AAJ6VVC5_9ACAR|nr:tRNA-dihydrouridine(20) synthase [NAD(P)+]-like [Galendromus occidentalis]